jgi:formyltetrahydrofolate deformylase
MNKNTTYIITASSPRRVGVLDVLTSTLSQSGAYMNEVHSFDDADTDTFFFRAALGFDQDNTFNEDDFNELLSKNSRDFAIDWKLSPMTKKSRVVIMVSKHDHCLNDLLYRYRTGLLNIEIPAIISNHPDLAELAKWHDIPYYHLPITADTKIQQEQKVMDIIEHSNADLVVLARYMQVLSPDMCRHLDGWAINIHHSLLPGFKGARPYQQAFDKGVKLVGATAHYVTSDLDEGPIITQCVESVNHNHSTTDLTEKGRHIECLTLARALKYHIEKRVFISNTKTIIFANT